jgi:hypothetical protein
MKQHTSKESMAERGNWRTGGQNLGDQYQQEGRRWGKEVGG